MSHRTIIFAKNLMTLRTLHEMTQQELADKIYVTRQTISTWELGAGKPDIYCLGGLCDLFDITPTQMLYGNVLSYSEDSLPEKEVIIKKEYKEDYSYVVSIITDEDLTDILDVLRYDFDKILVIALELHRRGYKITEIFDNGFGVLEKTTDDSSRLVEDLNEIIESLIHCDNPFIENRYTELSNRYSELKAEMIHDVMKEIWGDYPENYKYYWVDEMENPRGYANTEEECRQQARNQLCSWYKVMKRV